MCTGLFFSSFIEILCTELVSRVINEIGKTEIAEAEL